MLFFITFALAAVRVSKSSFQLLDVEEILENVLFTSICFLFSLRYPSSDTSKIVRSFFILWVLTDGRGKKTTRPRFAIK